MFIVTQNVKKEYDKLENNFGEEKSMQDEIRNNNNTYSGGPLSGLFRNCGCNNNGCGNDSTVLFFLIVFLLLFTNFGCCNNNNL